MDRHVQLARRPPQQQRGSVAAAANGDARRLEMCSLLYLAAYRGRAEEVMALLLQQRHGAPPADHQVAGIIHHGQCDILEETVERNTVLHVAAEQGHGELIQELYHRFIKKNGFLSRRNSVLDTPLHCAARAGREGAVTVLLHLARDCGENILGCQNAVGDTALHLAARHGHSAAVEALVAAADTSATMLNKAGVSPLYLAVMSRSMPAVRAITTTCLDASSIGPSSQNALHAAVFQSSEMVDLLLEWKPDLASQVDCNGSSPLHFAASEGSLSVVSAILDATPPTTVHMKDSDGLSALHVAARMGHHRVVKKLTEACPDAAEQLDGNGGTFVHTAAREKRSSVVALAIKDPMLGGLLNAQDGDGNTPLHHAVAAGAPFIVHSLLRTGKVQVDVLNDAGDTPLDLAAKLTSYFSMASLVVTLVAFGAQLRPQRQDHPTTWSSRDIAQRIEKSSEGLGVVAVLIATVAFGAGFNMPGGYGDNGTANLEKKLAFEFFMVLDSVAIAVSVVAVILLVYGRVSGSASSWKSFLAALNCIWASLVCLILAFFAASRAVIRTRAIALTYLATYLCVHALIFIMMKKWIEPGATMLRTCWLFRQCSKHAHAIKRHYPIAGVSLYNLIVFLAINFIVYPCFIVITTL